MPVRVFVTSGSTVMKQEQKATKDTHGTDLRRQRSMDSDNGNRPAEKLKRAAAVILILAAGFFVVYPPVLFGIACGMETTGRYREAARIYAVLPAFGITRSRYENARYHEAVSLLNDGNAPAAEGIFAELEPYGDSAAMRELCHLEIGNEYLKAGEYRIALGEFLQAGETEEAREALNGCRILMGEELLKAGKPEAALAEFEGAADTEAGREALLNCTYLLAKKWLSEGQYRKAADHFRELGDYRDSNELFLECRYQAALKLKNDPRKQVQGITAFRELDGYRDSGEQLLALEYAYVSSHMNPDDPMTEKYLKELMAETYLDVEDIYEQLYHWQIRIIVNESQSDTETDIDTASRDKVLWWHIQVTAGPPDESLEVRAVAAYPNGAEIDVWAGSPSFSIMRGEGFTTSTYYVDPKNGAAGDMTFSICDMEGGELSRKTVRLT